MRMGRFPHRKLYLLFSKHPSVLMSFISFTPTWLKTAGNLMLSTSMLVTKPPQNLGELDVLLLVFLVSEVVVLTGQVRVLLVTCVVVDVCSPPLKHGEDGTDPSTRNNEDMLSVQHWLPVQFLLC